MHQLKQSQQLLSNMNITNEISFDHYPSLPQKRLILNLNLKPLTKFVIKF